MGSAFSRALRLAPADSRGFVFHDPGFTCNKKNVPVTRDALFSI